MGNLYEYSTWRHRHESVGVRLIAEIWGAAIVAVGAIGGAAMSANASKNAAKKAGQASEDASQQAIDQQNLNYNRTASNLNPYISAGNNALGQMQQLNSGNFASFQQSPDYQFTLNQDLQGLDRSAAARGSLYSGGQSADVLNYASGLASQQYNSYYNKLAGLASAGQGSASNLGSIGAGQAGAIGSYLQNNATNQTNALYNGANAQANMYGQVAGAIGQGIGNYNANALNSSSYGGTAIGNTTYDNSGMSNLSTGDWNSMAGSTVSVG